METQGVGTRKSGKRGVWGGASTSRALALASLLGWVSAVVPASAGAQQLDRRAIDDVVSQVSDAIAENYVFPEVAARYVAGLADRARGYPDEMTASELADRVTADLQAIQSDRHLGLTVGPARTTGGGVRVAVRGGTPAPTSEPPPVAASPEQLYGPIDMAGVPEVGRRLFADEATRNHFFRAVEVLPGNVGYLDYDQFGFPNFSTDAADAAFAFLAETDAMILDLRGNRGGIEGMNQYLASHFFGEDPVHLYSRYYGTSRTTLEYPTFPDHVKRRFPLIPLFILVDGGTGSAAENFSFALQGLGRATIVGESTAGGAHSSRPYPIEPGFMLQLPIARAFNPRTDEDWEGVGVQPDVAVTSESALEVAHARAIDRLVESADPTERLGLEDAKLLMAARSADPVDPAAFTAYVGEYGTRRVFLEEGRLRMVRTDVPGMAPVDLVPLAADYFTLEQAAVARIRFERDDEGRVRRLHVRLPTGGWDVGERR